MPSIVTLANKITLSFLPFFQAHGQHGHHGLCPGRGGRLHRALPRHRPPPSVQGNVIKEEVVGCNRKQMEINNIRVLVCIISCTMLPAYIDTGYSDTLYVVI